MSKYTINFPIVRFYGEERLPNIPVPKLTFEPKLRHIKTHDIAFHKVDSPNKRFIPSIHHVPFSNSHYIHPHLQGLHLHMHDVSVKEEHIQHPEGLGIKERTKEITIPNEGVYEMGLQNSSIKDFAIANLQEEVGTVNNLTLHRDDQKYENVPMNKFMDNYSKFVKDKLASATADSRIQKVDDATTLSPDEKLAIQEKIKEKAKSRIKHKLTTRLVQPIETLAPTETVFQKATRPSTDTTTSVDDVDDEDDGIGEKTLDETLEEGGIVATHLFKGLKNKSILANIKDEKIKSAIKQVMEKEGYSGGDIETLTIADIKEFLKIVVKKKPPQPPSTIHYSIGDNVLPPPHKKSDKIRDPEMMGEH